MRGALGRVEFLPGSDLQADQEAMTDRPKRPRDANQLAKFIVDLATGDETPVVLPGSGASAHGGQGGKARAVSLTKEQRKEIARIAADARWKKT